jgi:hypothetical protein
MLRHPTPACKAAHASKAAQARIAGLTHATVLLAVKLNMYYVLPVRSKLESTASGRIQSIMLQSPVPFRAAAAEIATL